MDQMKEEDWKPPQDIPSKNNGKGNDNTALTVTTAVTQQSQTTLKSASAAVEHVNVTVKVTNKNEKPNLRSKEKHHSLYKGVVNWNPLFAYEILSYYNPLCFYVASKHKRY